MTIPTIEDVKQAAQKLNGVAHITPILSSSSINALAGAEIFFKCENFQRVGAFKFRGAYNAVSSLTAEQLSKGVATHSSGNHAQALALAAKLCGTNSTIVMPSNASKVKKQGVIAYSGSIIECEPNLQARQSTLDEFVIQSGAIFIHPYDNFQVISGQGTAALELLQAKPDLDTVIAPVGGGGLLAGTAISAKAINPNVKVIAAEPEGANDAFLSFYNKKWQAMTNPNTICDGLLTSTGQLNFEIIMEKVDDIFTANDNQIIDAMRLIWQRMKIIVETSCAVPLAIVLKNKEYFAGRKIGIILSGGNVDLDKLPWVS